MDGGGQASASGAAPATAPVVNTAEEDRKFAQLLQQLPEDDPRYAKIAALWKSRSALGTATERASAPKLEAEPPVLPTDNVELPQQLTPEQAVQMRAQMLAYKALSKNAPVAPVLQAAAAGVPVSVPPTRIDANGGVVSAEDAQATHDRLVEKLLSAYSQHQLQQQLGHRRGSLQDPLRIIDAKRLIVSTKAPLGLDPAQAIEQRDALAAVRIEQRIKELRSVPSNLPAEQKTRALIELKALKLLEFQRRMREEVLNSIQQNTSLEIGANRNMYKRVRRHAVREARMTERLERQQQLDREARERQRTKKHRDHLASIMQHAKEFKEYHRAHSNKASRLGKMVVTWHNNFEREEQRRQEKIQKDMIRYLRENDEAKFIELVKQAKNARVVYLLEQTDAFLNDLTGKVLEQKQEHRTAEEIAAAAEAEKAADGSQKKEFYQLAHSIFEPIDKQPDILVGGQLKDYQIKGLQWMVSLYNNNLNGILADEMGLGKTIQTIALVSYLMESKSHNGPFLILAPLSTLNNWKIEFERWAPSVQKVVYSGSKSARRYLQTNYLRNANFNVLLTTYEFVMRDIGVLSKIKWTYIIIDEGHRIKSKASKLTQILTSKYPAKHRLLLTGTPLQNNLPELWALLNFLLPRVFQSKQSFEDWFNAPFEKSPKELTGERLELSEEESLLVIRRLHKVLEPFMLRRLKKDVEANLPEKVERVIKCQMSGLQNMLYQQMKENNRLMISGDKKSGTVYQNLIMQLRKVCNHPFLFHEIEDQVNPNHLINDLVVRASGKFELLDRILPKLKAADHKTLIFFQSTNLMDIMEDYCQLRNYKILRLQGNTPIDERRDSVAKWNAPDSDYFLFLLTTRAGGLGLNLQSASTVILFESDWNPFADLQAQDRAHRIGQTNEVRVYRIITTDSIEEIILERAQFKLDVDAKVIQAGKFDQKTSHNERETMLKQLLQLDKDKEEEEAQVLDDEELNEILARNEEELELYTQIDREREATRRAEGRRGKPLPRLIDISELPPGLTMTAADNVVPVEEEELTETGRTKRKTRQLRPYSEDLLTEAQYLRIMENGEDLDDVLRKKLERRKRKDDNDADAASPTAETPPPQPPSSSRGGKRATPAADTYRAALGNVLNGILDHLEKVEEPETGRLLAELFLKLPPKSYYPDYYQIIAKPIAFDTVRKRIRDRKYAGVEDFVADMKLLFGNARVYNEEGSQVYTDSEALEAAMRARVDAVCPTGTFVMPGGAAAPTPRASSAASKPPPRKRARKSRARDESDEESEGQPPTDESDNDEARRDTDADDGDSADEHPNTPTRGGARGRGKAAAVEKKTPVKLSIKLNLGGGASPAATPKRRGRPPKGSTPSSGQRGRSSRKRARSESEEEPDDEDERDASDDDGMSSV